MLLDLPIAGRLTLGFLLAALLATIVTGTLGLQRVQSLNKQAAFYHDLLQMNTTLNTGANFLQLMNSQLHVTLSDATAAQPSQETLHSDQKAVQGLSSRYASILADYLGHHLIRQNADEASLLSEAGYDGQMQQQVVLIGSALRSWQVYQAAQKQILKDIASVTPAALADAQYLEHSQGEPTNADALSSLRALIQFDGNITTLIQAGADAERQTQLITTIISSIVTFLGIILVGWLISSTLVRRLRELRRVTRAVEQGRLHERVTVIGSDEIADVSDSVNAMLEAILSLLEETRRQRDALTNAAEHLFTDMRVVSAGDLRVNAPVSDDPIGMLANAFNFTVGRFRRFVLRSQATAEQLDVVARREIERTEAFLQAIHKFTPLPSTPTSQSTPSHSAKMAPGANKDPQVELLRLGSEFAADIAAQARKLTMITHEMRQLAISFQLDAANSGERFTPNTPINYDLKHDTAQGARPPVTPIRNQYSPATSGPLAHSSTPMQNRETGPSISTPSSPSPRFKNTLTNIDQSPPSRNRRE